MEVNYFLINLVTWLINPIFNVFVISPLDVFMVLKHLLYSCPPRFISSLIPAYTACVLNVVTMILVGKTTSKPKVRSKGDNPVEYLGVGL